MKKPGYVFLSAFFLSSFFASAAFAEIITGEVIGIDPPNHTLYISQIDPAGVRHERKFVWDDKLGEDAETLTAAQIGQRISVDAYRGFFDWKVKSVAGAAAISAPVDSIPEPEPVISPETAAVLPEEPAEPAPVAPVYEPAAPLDPRLSPQIAPPSTPSGLTPEQRQALAEAEDNTLSVRHASAVSEAPKSPAIVSAPPKKTPVPIETIASPPDAGGEEIDDHRPPVKKKRGLGQFLVDSINGAAKSVDGAMDRVLP